MRLGLDRLRWPTRSTPTEAAASKPKSVDQFERGGSGLSEPSRPSEAHSFQRLGRLATDLAGKVPLCDVPGEVRAGTEHRFVLGAEEAQTELPRLVTSAYYAVRESALREALDDLKGQLCSTRQSVHWSAPELPRNLSFGTTTMVQVQVDAEPRPDARWEVRVRVPAELHERVLGAAGNGRVAWPRHFERDFPTPWGVDEIAFATEVAWPASIVGPESRADAERLGALQRRELQRTQKAAHRQSILRLFDELWPPGERPKARQRAEASVKSCLQKGAPTPRELLAAMTIPGARSQLRRAAAKMASWQGQTVSLEGRLELEARPARELEAKIELQGRHVLAIRHDEVLSSDFRAEHASVVVQPQGDSPVSRSAVGAAAGMLDLALRQPACAEGPAFRLSEADRPHGERSFLDYQTAGLRAEMIVRDIVRPDGRPGSRHGFLHRGLVFHGNGGLSPNQVFRDGIPAKLRPEIFDLARHQTDDARSALRGSCLSPETPSGFAGEGGHVYVLFPVGGALDLQVLDFGDAGSRQASGARGETELAFGSHQPSQVVVGAYPVGARPNEHAPYHRLGAFVPNPNLDRALLERLPERFRAAFESS